MATPTRSLGRSVLVVYKQAPSPSRRVPAAAAKAHLHVLEHLYHILQGHRVLFRAIPIEQLGPVRRSDRVITVGGDGTVLATSHFVTRQPILGVKSFGETSVGHFCASTAETLEHDIAAMLRGTWAPRQFTRLAATVDGHNIQELVLNDCLFAHGSPAAITDYRLTIGNRSEVQRSSGIWISTAAGSTAGIASAGGKPMSLTSTRLQYLVREPYAPHRAYRLLEGILPHTAVIEIESFAQHGTFSIDGAHIQYPAPDGTRLTIRQAKFPLALYWR